MYSQRVNECSTGLERSFPMVFRCCPATVCPGTMQSWRYVCTRSGDSTGLERGFSFGWSVLPMQGNAFSASLSWSHVCTRSRGCHRIGKKPSNGFPWQQNKMIGRVSTTLESCIRMERAFPKTIRKHLSYIVPQPGNNTPQPKMILECYITGELVLKKI